MQVKTIPSSWLYNSGLRLDCNPYMSGAFEAREILKSLSARKDPLNTLTKGHAGGIYNGPIFRRNYVESPEFGVRFLTSSSMLLADLSHLPFLSKKDAHSSKLSYLEIKEGMTLISCSGTIGRMVYARPDMDGIWSCQDMLKVVADPEKIPPGYLYAFLSSKFGIPQIVSGTYGAIIQHIEPHHIANLPIPRLGKEIERKIHALISQSASNLSLAQKLFTSATQTLFSKIGLEDIGTGDWFSDLDHLGWRENTISSESFRAFNFDPRVFKLIIQLKKGKNEPLGSLCQPRFFKGKTVFKRIDCLPEFGRLLVGQREAFRIRPEGRYISHKSIEGLGLCVPPSSVLIPSHGTLGESELYCRAVFVSRKTSVYAFSGDFFRCIPIFGKIGGGFLFSFLRSNTAFRILRSTSTGSKQQEEHPKLIWRIPIPRLHKSDENEIEEMANAGSRAFDEALEMEEKAWGVLEKEVEKAGEKTWGR